MASVASCGEGGKAGLGHAFGFISKRPFRGRNYPMVPLLLNTYVPPNVPGAARCHDIGRALRGVMRALETGDAATLRAIPRPALKSGSSEILNWVLAAGAVEGMTVQWSEYLPLVRTPAGTGVGAGFVLWQPAAH